MADLKISQLPSVAEQDIAGVDEIPLNDVSASQTSKVAVKDLIERGFALADAGSIPATLLAALPNNSVTAASIDGKAITRNQILDNTIQAGQIDANTITSNEIATNSLTNVLAPGSVSSTELDALSVGTTELQLLAVGNAQVADTSLTYAKLNLADGDIPGAKINTLDGSKIVDTSIGNAKISDVDGSKIVDGSISYAKLDSNDIARGLSIDSTAGTLGIANNISSGTFAGISYSAQGLITSVATTIPATDLPIADASNLGGIKIGTGLSIVNTSGVVSISAGGITASNLATDSVATSSIQALAVTDAKINDISGSKITAGTITYDKLDPNDLDRGLNIDETAGTIGINNSVTGGASQKGGIIYNALGLITGKLDTIASADLPTADANNLGAIKIGTGLAIANGVVSIDSSSIEASNLADDAVETANIKDLNVTDGKIAGVSGAKITAGTVTYDKLDSADVGRGLSIDNTAGDLGIANSITAGSAGAVSFNQFGLITSTRTIPGSEIEPATTSTTGAIQIGSGLSVNSSGEASVSGVTAAMVDTSSVGRGLDISGGTIGIASSLSSSGTFAGIGFSAQGVITSVDSVIPSTDLPIAGTASSGIGCVYVPTGSGLALDTSTGALSVDSSGFGTAQIGDLAVTTAKLADLSVTNAKVNDVSGSKLSAGSVTYDKLDATDIARGLSIDSTAGTLGLANSISSGSFAGLSYNEFGEITSVAALIPATDLPAATTTTLGAISVSNGLAITTAGALSVSGITNAMLGTDSVQTAQVQNLAITDAKIAGVSGAKITAGTLSPSALNSSNVTNGLTVSGGNLQIDNSVSGGASSFAGLSFNSQGLITNVSALIPSTDLPISSSTALGGIKVGSNLSIDASTGVLSVAVDGIGTVNLSDDCITSAELSAGAVDNAALGTGLSGAKISNNTLPAAAIVSTDLDRSLSLSSGKLGISNVISAATHSGVQFNAQGLIVGTSSILASELPIADASNVGAVSIGSNSGLSVTSGGSLSLSNSYTGSSTVNGLTINSYGQITATQAIVGSDINVASSSSLGVIRVASTGPFSIDTSGELNLSNSGVTAGTYTSVTVDVLGRVTTGSQITEAQLPDHSAAKITTGTLSVDRIQNSSIAGNKLSDASVTLFGGPSSTSNVVTFPATGNFKGQYFWDELNSDLYLYTGSSWVPVTISSGEIVFGGLYDASNNTVSTVSSAGSAAGLTVGSGLPQATTANERLYVVVDATGTGSSPAPAVTLNPPDYIISDGSSWEHLDVSGAIAATTAGNVGVSAVAPDISTNVQQSLENLQTNKLNKSGGDISGTVRFTSTGVLQFEGSEDAFETTLGVVSPTVSDKTILLPDESGTLITTASTGVVTSSLLSNDITNSNIASNAALSFTKLEALNSGNILIGNASNEVASVAMSGDVGINNAGLTTIQPGAIVDSMIDSSAAISASKIQGGSLTNAGVLQLVNSTSSTSTSLAATANSVKSAFDLATQADTTASSAAAKSGDTFTGNVIISDAKELRFGEVTATGSNYISFRAPDAITSDISLIWPSNSPSGGQILKANASNPNQLEWDSSSSSVTAESITGTTLASNVVGSSLTSLGTLSSLTVSGTITGSVTGDLTGNADTATTLATARAINGESFNGSSDITVTASAGTLTGTSLNSTITSSSLTSVGTIANLTATNCDITTQLKTDSITYSNASNSHIDFFAGSYDFHNAIGNNFLQATSGGQIKLYHSNALKAETVSGGFTVTGTCTATSFAGDGSNLTGVGATTINNNADNRIITGSGTANTLNGESDITYDGTNLDIANNKTIRIGGTAGSTSLNIYNQSGAGSIALLGTGALTLNAATLYLKNPLGETYLKAVNNAQVELYYDNSKKAETTTSGFTVDGTCIATSFSGDGSNLTNLPAGGTTYNTTSKNLYTSGAGNSNGGESNISLGTQAGAALGSGDDSNTCIGSYAGQRCTGLQNVIIGSDAGKGLTEADSCVVIGDSALSKNTATYQVNGGVFIGHNCFKDYDPPSWSSNSLGFGPGAGSSQTTGSELLFVGGNAGSQSTTGYSCTAIGHGARVGTTGNSNTSVGVNCGGTGTGSNCLTLGKDAAPSTSSASNEVTLGNSSISALRCQVTSITALSDKRDKTDINTLDLGLQFINALNPVKFKWDSRDKKLLKNGTYEAGFIAQDFQQVQKDYDAEYLKLVLDSNPEKLEASPGKLIPILVQAIKELSAKVELLETKTA